MMVHAGEQGRPAGRAQGSGMEVSKAESGCGQRVEVGSVDLRPVATDVGEPEVVAEDDDDVGCSFWWGPHWLPPGLRIGQRAADAPPESVVRSLLLPWHGSSLPLAGATADLAVLTYALR